MPTESQPTADVRTWVLERRPVERWAYLVGVGLIIVGLAHLVVATVEPRPWLGPLSWRKPVTFGVSFGSVLIAVTWVSSYLRLTDRTRTLVLGVFTADCVVEVTGITVQAWRHTPSHFNNVGPLNSTIAFTLAAGGGVLIVTLGRLAVAALRGEVDARPSMRLALRGGFALLLAGLAAGVAMIVRGEQLIREGHRGLAYTAAGYLKWFHAITLHAVLVLPLLAWWLARTHRTERRRQQIVAVGIAVYIGAAVIALVVCLIRM
jgi:hypothetical protein